jgi:hypothetical protein
MLPLTPALSLKERGSKGMANSIVKYYELE